MANNDNTDHDRLFKELITTFFVEFIQLFAPDMLEYLDVTTIKPVDKEMFSDVPDRRSFVVDILMEGTYQGKNSQFLIHVENQSYAQADFEQRMFDYFYHLWKKYKKDIYSFAIFSYDEPYRKEPAMYRMDFGIRPVLRYYFDVIQLNRLRWRKFVKNPNPVASALMAKMKIAPKDRVKVKIECLRMLVGLKLNPARTSMISDFIGTYLKLNAEDEKKFEAKIAKELPPEETREVKRVMNGWVEQGIEKGIEMGQKQGQVKLVTDLLNFKINGLKPEVIAQVQALPDDKLGELARALFEFTTPADVENWLKQQA